MKIGIYLFIIIGGLLQACGSAMNAELYRSLKTRGSPHWFLSVSSSPFSFSPSPLSRSRCHPSKTSSKCLGGHPWLG